MSVARSRAVTPRRVDPLRAAGAAFFVLAVAAAAYPAVRAGPATVGGLILLIGLATVCFLGLFAFARPEARKAPPLDGFVRALAEPAAILSPDGRMLAANPAWREAFGDARRLTSSSSGVLFAALSAARRGEAAKARVRFGGRERPIVASGVGEGLILIRLEDAGAEAATSLLAAVSEIGKPDSDAAMAVAAALDAFAAAAPFGAALLEGTDPFESAIVEANPALAAMAGGRDMVGARFGDMIEQASQADAMAAIAQGKSPVEVRLASEPSHIAQLYLSRVNGSLLAYLVDVSAQKALELQLAQSQKMQAIGQLAGGVAHDFNNLLTAIQLRLDELLHRHPVGDPSYEGLNEIRQTGVRAADLVRKLLAFSRKQTVQREVLDLGELISEFEVLLRRLLREDVKLQTDYGRNLPMVRADKAQLETAVMNLAVNARDAMKGQDGGLVRIRTARLSRAEAMALGYTEPPAGEFGLIEVADTGTGIAPDVIDKIFEPFFTTKAVGEGTGFGLATVYGIVPDHRRASRQASPGGPDNRRPAAPLSLSSGIFRCTTTRSKRRTKGRFTADLLAALDALTAGESDGIANMANAAALLWEALPEINWAGFYRNVGGELVLGRSRASRPASAFRSGAGCAGRRPKRWRYSGSRTCTPSWPHRLRRGEPERAGGADLREGSCLPCSTSTRPKKPASTPRTKRAVSRSASCWRSGFRTGPPDGVR